MQRQQNKTTSYLIGILLSLFAHVACVVIAVVALENKSAQAVLAPEVFTVTLEPGEKLGGINQVPKEGAKAQKVLPDAPPAADEPVKKAEPAAKKIEAPTAVEDIEKKKQDEQKKKEAELKKKQEAEKKRKEVEAKKREDEKRKKEAEAKKREADQKRKEEAAKRKREEEARAKAERDRKLRQAIERSASRYEGESTNAGGEGFGAARTGGSGMGGGTLESIEFISYRNALEAHIKGGWHWLPGAQQLRAIVRVTILPTGAIQNAAILQSSGRDDFDDSILRAVYKASPVPPAPAHLYKRFQDVRITFDSHQN